MGEKTWRPMPWGRECDSWLVACWDACAAGAGIVPLNIRTHLKNPRPEFLAWYRLELRTYENTDSLISLNLFLHDALIMRDTFVIQGVLGWFTRRDCLTWLKSSQSRDSRRNHQCTKSLAWVSTNDLNSFYMKELNRGRRYWYWYCMSRHSETRPRIVHWLVSFAKWFGDRWRQMWKIIETSEVAAICEEIGLVACRRRLSQVFMIRKRFWIQPVLSIEEHFANWILTVLDIFEFQIRAPLRLSWLWKTECWVEMRQKLGKYVKFDEAGKPHFGGEEGCRRNLRKTSIPELSDCSSKRDVHAPVPLGWYRKPLLSM